MSKPSLYERIGGKAGIERLVQAYLSVLGSKPEASELHSMYHRGFDHYQVRMIEYLCGFLGGPGLYLQNHGLPRLRENHRRIPITAAMRDQWYGCMSDAVDRTVEPGELNAELKAVFWSMADSLCN